MNQVVGKNRSGRYCSLNTQATVEHARFAYYCPNRRLKGSETSSLPRARSAVKGGGIRLSGGKRRSGGGRASHSIESSTELLNAMHHACVGGCKGHRRGY